MPVTGPLSFDACMARVASGAISGIDDPEAFCAALESGDVAKRFRELLKRGKRPVSKRRTIAVTIPIQKVDHEQGLATGWASIVTDANGVPIVDFDGDVIRVEDLEKAAQDAFMQQSGAGRGGDMHDPDGVGKASIVESMVITKAKREALGFGPGPEGWIVTLKIHDPELRRQIREGEKLELSMAGTAEPVEMDEAA